MKILVTGGAGFIGTNLIKLLLEHNHEVISIDNYSTGLVSNHLDGAGYIKHDISSPLSIQVYGRFDIVYHMAAIARIQPSFENPLKYFNYNAMGTFNVSQYCVKHDVPMIFAGSSSHHSGKFKNPYTFSKDVSEEIIQLHQEHFGLKASIARFYNVYGPNHLRSGSYCTLIGAWENMYLNKNPLKIHGDGTKRRDFTHVADIVTGLFKIQTHNAWGYIFELGRGKNYSVNEIAKMFNTSVEYGPDKPGEALETLCTDQTAKTILDWNPTHNIEDYINQFIHENNL